MIPLEYIEQYLKTLHRIKSGEDKVFWSPLDDTEYEVRHWQRVMGATIDEEIAVWERLRAKRLLEVT
jgi:hypothetical protein